MITAATGRLVGTALLVVAFHAGRADDPSPLPPNAETPAHAAANETLRPYLQTGFFVGTAHDGGFAGDFGLRVDKLLAAFAYRLDIGDKGYLTYAGGRAGYILAENG